MERALIRSRARNNLAGYNGASRVFLISRLEASRRVKNRSRSSAGITDRERVASVTRCRDDPQSRGKIKGASRHVVFPFRQRAGFPE